MIKEIYNEHIKETIYSNRLENGLEVFYLPKKDYVKQYAIFATKYGSNDLVFKTAGEVAFSTVPEGIAHFLEHKLFEEPEGNVFDRFAALGANVNAYTNFNITAYYFTSTSFFFENLDILIHFVQSPYFTEENVEKEKGIIEQEIKMYQDNPDWRVFFNLLKGMYHNHPVKNDIAGTVDSINSITKEDLYRCYNTFYHPSNMALFIAGDLDKEEVFRRVSEGFTKLKHEAAEAIERLYKEEPSSIKESAIEEKMLVSTPLFQIGFKDIQVPMEGLDLLSKEISVRILVEMLFGKSSDLYEELYEKGLIDPSFGVDYVCEKDYGHIIISGESKNPTEVQRIINQHIKTLQENGLNKDNFERVKRKQIGENLAYFNSIEFIGNSFIGYYFKDINFLDYVKMLEETEFEVVEDYGKKLLDTSRQVISIINPM